VPFALCPVLRIPLQVWDASDVVTGRRLVGGTTVRLFSEPQSAAPHFSRPHPPHTQSDSQPEGQAPRAAHQGQHQQGQEGGAGEGGPRAGRGRRPGPLPASAPAGHAADGPRRSSRSCGLGREADGDSPTTSTPGKVRPAVCPGYALWGDLGMPCGITPWLCPGYAPCGIRLWCALRCALRYGPQGNSQS